MLLLVKFATEVVNFPGCGFIKGYDQNGCISFFSDINCNEAKAQTTEEGSLKGQMKMQLGVVAS